METTLKTADGLTLQLREWRCAKPIGTVLIVHGLGEHIGRYAHVAAHLLSWGWNVVGYDQRGHGASEGPRGRLEASDDLLRDLAGVIDATRAAHDGPLVLLGHSMGALVAGRFVAEGVGRTPPRDRNAAGSKARAGLVEPAPMPASTSTLTPATWYRAVDALVLSSPAFDLGMRAAQKALLAVLGPVAPDLAVANGLKPEWVSRAGSVVAAYGVDPLVHDRVAPRLVRFMVDGGAFVLAHASHWTVPTLLMWAGSDLCVAPAGSAAFAAAAPRHLVEALEFKPLYHEIFNEPEQAEVFAALHKWLASRALRGEGVRVPLA